MKLLENGFQHHNNNKGITEDGAYVTEIRI